MLNQRQEVVERLAAADRRHQKEAGGRLLLRSLKYGCALVLAAFVADVALHLSAGWRLGLVLALLGGAAALAIAAWRVAFVRRNRLERIARFLEGRAPALGSSLINLLQLQVQVTDPALSALTRDLARQAVEGYAAQLKGTPLERLAWTGELRRHLKRAAWALLGFAALLAAFFRVTAVEVARFADPYGDHPPYSFTRLEIVEPGRAGTNVLYGKGIVVKVKAAGHQPREVFLSTFPPGHPERTLTVAMFDKGAAGFHQLVDNVRADLLAFAHTKDRTSVSKQVRLGVILTPQLERALVQVTPPAYTGLKPDEQPYAFKAVQALEGSQVRFRLQSNRPLREGLLQLCAAEQPPQRIALARSAENEVAGAFTAADSCRLRFSILDVAGLPSQADLEGALTVTHDLPPEVRITEPAHDAFVALDFKFQAHIEANDDYGLRSVRIHRGVNGVYPAPKAVSYEGIVRDSHETMDFDLQQLGVKAGDIISLFAEAVDNAPQPHLARSQTLRLSVISVEDYNNLLREQTDLSDTEAKYAALMEDLQELADDQKKLGGQFQQLQEQTAKAGPKERDELPARLDQLLARQNELNQKLNQQAERMDHFVRDNPLYDVERELQDLLRQEAGQVRQSTGANNDAARDVAQRSMPPGGARQVTPAMLSDLKRASDDQVARLGGVEEAGAKRMSETLQEMGQMQELQKDFNQFEDLYRAQKELAAQTQAYNRAGQLDREDQLALKELAATEKQVGEALDQVEQKLREDAKAAAKLFPKAAQSGHDLADKINELRLGPLARQATGQMLAGNGDRSFRLAERLRGEMDKLFTEAQGGNCPSCEELDGYLTLQRGMKPGNNFSQMARSRKGGQNLGRARGQGMAQGQGQTGSSGYAVLDDSIADVMGNETHAQRGSATARQSSRLGKGLAAPSDTHAATDAQTADVVKNLNPVNRQSGAVSPEALIEEYSDLVDSYFKTITTRKKE